MSNKTYKVDTGSKRRCSLYFKYLNKKNIRVVYDPSLSTSALCNIINNSIDNHFKHYDKDDKDESTYILITNMRMDCSRDFIEDSELDWLKNNDKACSIAWLYIRELRYRRVNRYYSDNKNLAAYTLMGLPRKVITTQQRYDAFIEYIDSIILDRREKIKLLETLKDKYTETENLIYKFHWIERGNNKSVRWAWNYIAKKIDIPYYLKQVDLDEQYLSIYSILSLWDGSEKERELFLSKMANAWRQITNREKNKNNKLINTYIGSEHKEYLDELAKHYGSTFRRTLEIAIENEYNRITKP